MLYGIDVAVAIDRLYYGLWMAAGVAAIVEHRRAIWRWLTCRRHRRVLIITIDGDRDTVTVEER